MISQVNIIEPKIMFQFLVCIPNFKMLCMKIKKVVDQRRNMMHTDTNVVDSETNVVPSGTNMVGPKAKIVHKLCTYLCINYAHILTYISNCRFSLKYYCMFKFLMLGRFCQEIAHCIL